MQKLFYSRKRNKRGFNLIELIVVIAIVGIMVMIAAPKFFGYTNDSRVAAMKADAKILSGAAAIFHIDKNAWPIGAEVIKGAGLEAVIGDIAVYEIDEDALDPYVKNIKGEYSDYGIITTGEMEGEVIHLSGVTAKDETVWFGTDLNSDSLPVDEPVDYAVCAAGVYLATDEDFEGDADGEFIYTGDATEVRIPHVIKGVEVTSYMKMFNTYDGASIVTKVVSDNPNVTDMYGMFAMVNDEPLDLSCFDTSGVTTMEYMFSGVEIPSLDLSGFDTSKVENMENMFDWSVIPSLNLSGWDTSNVMYMGWMFLDSTTGNLDLNGWDVSNVEDMSSMFQGSKAVILDISDWDTSKVTDMSWMFAYSAATSLDLSGWDTSNVTDMSYMFDESAIENLDLNGWDVSNVEDMSGMFKNTVLETIDLSSFDTQTTANPFVADMFNNTTATVGYAQYEDDALYFNQSSNKPAYLTFVNTKISPIHNATDSDFIGETNGEFRYIGEETRIKIPHVIKGVNVTSYANMFNMVDGCTTAVTKVVSDNTNITDATQMFFESTTTVLDVSEFDTSSITNMTFMFNGFRNLTALDVSSLDTSNATTMKGMFGQNPTLTSLDLTGFNTSNVTDMSGMFHQAIMLDSLDVSMFDTGNVTDMMSMFSQIKAATLDLSNFDTSKVTNMSGMFYGARTTTLDLSSFNTNSVTTMGSMFGNTRVTLLDLSSFNTGHAPIMSYMFQGTITRNAYAKTAGDVTRLRASSNRPATLSIVVKP